MLKLTCAAALLGAVSASPYPFHYRTTNLSSYPIGADTHKCPLKSGDFNVTQFQLYPENAEWNPDRCLVAYSALYNASLVIYDPYAGETVEIVNFEGLSGDTALHATGIKWENPDVVAVVIDAAAAYLTSGADLTGDNYLVKYDITLKKEVFRANVTDISNAGKVGGYQDIGFDPLGNHFYLGAYPSSIIKISADGSDAALWWNPQEPKTGEGAAAVTTNGNILLAVTHVSNEVLRFDMSAEEGEPVSIPITPAGSVLGTIDGARLLPKYKGKILIVSDDYAGAAVLRSKDGLWNSAEFLGKFPNPAFANTTGAFTTQSLQISDSIYLSTEFFHTNGAAGYQSRFPMGDITEAVEALFGDWWP